MRRITRSVASVTLLISSLLLPDISAAQQAARSGEATKPARSSSITGRVVGEGGQPLVDAPVFALPMNSLGDQNSTLASMLRPVLTDADGRFEIKDLVPRAYTVTASVPGYITSGNPQHSYYRPGDTLTISMIKGGVITGKVITATGEPLVGIRVRAVRVKDADNRPVRLDISSLSSPASSESLRWEWMTDDRGVYRIYGLEPGIYTVAAGGRGLTPSQKNGYDGNAPSYHPSGTVDTAAEVLVRAGTETTNVDIRYREDRGRVVSGSVSGSVSNFVLVTMLRASSGLPENMSFALPDSSGPAFLFDSMADGDYYLFAMSMTGMNEGEAAASKLKRVSVKGADVTGIELALAPLASISGRVVIERAAKPDCKPARPSLFQEIVLKAQSDRKEKLRDEPDSLLAAYANNSPSEKGEFQIRYLDEGLKRLVVQLPSEDQYIRSIALTPTTPNAKPVELAGNPINIKSGDKISGLTVTLSEGASSLSGRVALPKDDPTPLSRMRVYLIPAEPESADNLLRYFESSLQSDGIFKFTNLAPGRYWILARPLVEEESVENSQRPLAWDAADRMGLRFEGEAAATVIELNPCQRIADYTVGYNPPKKIRK